MTGYLEVKIYSALMNDTLCKIVHNIVLVLSVISLTTGLDFKSYSKNTFSLPTPLNSSLTLLQKASNDRHFNRKKISTVTGLKNF